MKKFFYRAEKGDTVFSLSNRFSVPPTKLISLNRLCREICEGDLLYIESVEGCLYKVKPFDTAKSVSEKFCVSEEKILKDNGVEYLFYGLTITV